ncbi:MAG: YkgJ family cysteine cluster protein [Limisphaerales bacterium]
MNCATTSDLCVECGLCCNGSLFADVELANRRESILMESAGAVVDEDDDSLLLIQPCSALQGKRCSIYHHRPKCCRTFECLLLKRFQRNEVSFEVARKQIREALQLKANIEMLFPPAVNDEPNVCFKERCDDAISTFPEKSRKAAQLEQMAVDFERLVRDVFLGPNISA